MDGLYGLYVQTVRTLFAVQTIQTPMVASAFGTDAKHINREYLEMRQKARQTTFNLSEWGDIDISKHDLDTVKFDRTMKESTYKTESKIDAEGGANSGFDIRELPTRE